MELFRYPLPLPDTAPIFVVSVVGRYSPVELVVLYGDPGAYSDEEVGLTVTVWQTPAVGALPVESDRENCK